MIEQRLPDDSVSFALTPTRRIVYDPSTGLVVIEDLFGTHEVEADSTYGLRKIIEFVLESVEKSPDVFQNTEATNPNSRRMTV